MIIKSDFFLKDNSRTSGEMLDRHNRQAIEPLIIENEDELLVTENDPCHCWVCIEDVVDPDSPDGFYEISQATEIEETIQNFENGKLIDFEEVEDGSHFGKIISASIDVKTGMITLHREEIPNETLLTEKKSIEPDLYSDDCDFYFPRRKSLNFSFYQDPWYDESPDFRRSTENLKTMSDSKLQRMCRKQLRAIRRKF